MATPAPAAAAAAAPAPAAAAADSTAAAAAAPTGTASVLKIFAGNLSFKTRDADLAHEFAAAGTVMSANIITRGPRSLGYGFVEMSTDEEVHKAVELLNKKEIEGRQINVEIARPRPADAAAPGERRRTTRRRRAPRRRTRAAAADGSAPATTGQQTGAAPKAAPAEGETGAAPKTRGGRPRRTRTRSTEQKDRPPSETTLFVANLPFAVDDARLTELFNGHPLKSAHVVVKHNGRSKGFGFVELESNAAQLKALAAFEKFVCDGRELIVKIALTEAPKEATPAAAAPAAGAVAATPAADAQTATA